MRVFRAKPADKRDLRRQEGHERVYEEGSVSAAARLTRS